MNQHTFDDEPDDGQPQRRPRRFGRRNAQLITDARRSPEQDRRHRERAYSWLQLSRLPFLLLSAASYLWWENWWISGVLFLISVPLPWIAVVIANGHGEPRDKRTAQVYKPAAAREYYAQLEARRREAVEAPSPPALPPATAPDVIDHDESSEGHHP
ncbi:hypothetical protein CATRI_07565 [Corynebacterium atrinae]|uniref:DUF3099 domain-containing protein n=1 Tax=Corynebacterium atrinae TaxID=1336740 RepID=UPI0025B5F814|nr:DUF3099 domain-containing protein [Corynebacterium atrinae]WJY63585.1 hypothetical protein CATRI_07565 [Corynebacterium atrinae]